MAAPSLDPQYTKKLREALPGHYSDLLFERLGGKYTRRYIQMVIQGQRQNDEVVEGALLLAEELRVKRIEQAQRIANL